MTRDELEERNRRRETQDREALKKLYRLKAHDAFEAAINEWKAQRKEQANGTSTD